MHTADALCAQRKPTQRRKAIILQQNNGQGSKGQTWVRAPPFDCSDGTEPLPHTLCLSSACFQSRPNHSAWGKGGAYVFR